MYYEYDTGYYEPSDADIFFDEMKEKFREYLTDEIKYELDRLSKENEEQEEYVVDLKNEIINLDNLLEFEMNNKE